MHNIHIWDLRIKHKIASWKTSEPVTSLKKDWALHVSSSLILSKSADKNLLLIRSGCAADSVGTPSSSAVATQTLCRVNSGKTFSIHSTEKRGSFPRFTQLTCNAEITKGMCPLQCVLQHTKTLLLSVTALLLLLVRVPFLEVFKVSLGEALSNLV